ncbi:hypothetical protein VSR34_17825 [Paraburkholderia sp. JHI2823]|uniref:hypothetical protein n=1 Tax=Paraburkholderia TaxID=1822464 RepID=UPI00317F8240
MEEVFKGAANAQTEASCAGERSRPWPRFAGSLPKALVAVAAACTVLAGCASAGDVAAADKQGTYVVTASATGGRLAWARAHKRAVSEATRYCEGRGMQTSLGLEHTEGLEALKEQSSVINFECQPKL